MLMASPEEAKEESQGNNLEGETEQRLCENITGWLTQLPVSHIPGLPAQSWHHPHGAGPLLVSAHYQENAAQT